MKLLYNTSTQLFQPYPRSDDGEVVGLDSVYQVFTVIQDAEPSSVPVGYHLKAAQTINYEARTVHNSFTVEENIPLPAREATRLQVRLFLRRCGIDPETIPALIASVTAEGEEREEALERWKSTQSFPKAYPLVYAVAALLSLNLDEVWDSILAIE